MPHRILFDQASTFGEPNANFARISSIEVQLSDVKAHSSLNIGERYHQPFQNTFRKLMVDRPGADNHLTLALSVK